MEKYDTLDAYWHDIHDTALLTENEEKVLGERILKGEKEAVERLVTANLRYVVSIARQYSQKEESIDIEDFISEGNLAMMTAATKWNPAEEKHFISYASHDIKRAMDKLLKQSENEYKLRSTDAPSRTGQVNPIGDKLQAGKPFTEDQAEIHEASESLIIAMRYLNEREKEILRLYYGLNFHEKLSMAEIGDKMNLKRERVRQIRKTAERKMRKYLK